MLKKQIASLAGAVAVACAVVMTSSVRADGPCEPAWQAFTSGGQIGVGVGGGVVAQTVWNGDLIAGGAFTTAGGQTVNRIARWYGSAWHPLGSGMNAGVYGPDCVQRKPPRGTFEPAIFHIGGLRSPHLVLFVTPHHVPGRRR